MIFWLTIASCVLAVIPAALFFQNLPLYAPLPRATRRANCSVLIPARNEEANIAAALRSILQSEIVLLGFLPLERMRKSPDPRFAAACGHILAVRREAYDRYEKRIDIDGTATHSENSSRAPSCSTGAGPW